MKDERACEGTYGFRRAKAWLEINRRVQLVRVGIQTHTHTPLRPIGGRVTGEKWVWRGLERSPPISPCLTVGPSLWGGLLVQLGGVTSTNRTIPKDLFCLFLVSTFKGLTVAVVQALAGNLENKITQVGNGSRLLKAKPRNHRSHPVS